MSAIEPIIGTPDIDRLLAFYTSLLGAEQIRRVPDDGPVFYLGLRVGDSELGLVAEAGADLSAEQRVLLSVEVGSVDDLLTRVETAGGEVRGPANDMPWGQRVAHIKDPDGNPVNLTQPVSPQKQGRR